MNKRSLETLDKLPVGKSTRHGSCSARIVSSEWKEHLRKYTNDDSHIPLLFLGEARSILSELPDESADCVMTSPPYWSKREYADGGIGLERDYRDYMDRLATVFLEMKRVLKLNGSFWLNIGDAYKEKNLLGIPWRIVLEMTDKHGWILRNSIIWNKVKSGMDTTKDRLGNVHENVFHLVKNSSYYYDVDAIRSKPREARVVNGAVVSATGVSGIRYRRQIEMSTALEEKEKKLALKALERILGEVEYGRLADFRMILRGQQRATHSDNARVSGRAKELQDKGFYFLRYHPKGSKPSDVWNIIPEDTQKRIGHFAAYPVDLCRIPILATCPPKGIVLDPFCGTGTTLYAAKILGRKSVGIDISREYLDLSRTRCESLL